MNDKRKNTAAAKKEMIAFRTSNLGTGDSYRSLQ